MQKTNEQLVALIKSGIDEADNMLELWQQNRRFIRKIANKYKSYEDFEDLEQQGYIGLCDAVRGYRTDENVPFINYAAFWIKQSIMRYIESSGGIVRIPTQTKHTYWKYKKFLHDFEAQVGRKPSDKEICWHMGIRQEELGKIKGISKMAHIGSLDCHIADGEDTTIGDLVSGDADVESSVLDKIEREELKQVLWSMVDALPEEQAQVIRSLYKEGKTLEETGKTIGISLGRVRAVKQTAFKGLQRPSRRIILEAFLPEFAESMAYRHNGIDEFNRTWTSSTELTALKLYRSVPR